MDLSQNRKAWGAGAAVGFGLLVAWMMPPTDPRPMAPNWRANVKPTAPPAPIDFAGFAPVMAGATAYPVQGSAFAETVSAQPASDDVTEYRGRSGDDETQPPAQEATLDSDGIARPVISSPAPAYQTLGARPIVRPPTPGYRDGRRWAQRHDSFESRDCSGAPSEAAENRCRDYVYAHNSDEMAEDGARPLAWVDAADDD